MVRTMVVLVPGICCQIVFFSQALYKIIGNAMLVVRMINSRMMRWAGHVARMV
jgi:hypothetical protein